MSGEADAAPSSPCPSHASSVDALAEVADEGGQAPADQTVTDRGDDEQRRASVEEAS